VQVAIFQFSAHGRLGTPGVVSEPLKYGGTMLWQVKQGTCPVG
jgi:hypothetical protein